MKARAIFISAIAATLAGCTHSASSPSPSPKPISQPTASISSPSSAILLDASGTGEAKETSTEAHAGVVMVQYTCSKVASGEIDLTVTGNSTGHRWLRSGGDTCDGQGIRTINMHVDNDESAGLTVDVQAPPGAAWAVVLSQA